MLGQVLGLQFLRVGGQELNVCVLNRRGGHSTFRTILVYRSVQILLVPP